MYYNFLREAQTSMLGSLRQILKSEGVVGFWKGNAIVCFHYFSKLIVNNKLAIT